MVILKQQQLMKTKEETMFNQIMMSLRFKKKGLDLKENLKKDIKKMLVFYIKKRLLEI